MESPYYNLGLAVGASAYGVTTEDVMAKKASTDTLADHKQYGYGAIQRLLCKYAAAAYKESGQMEKFTYHVFNKLASARPWWPDYDEYYDAAAVAIGRVHTSIRKQAALDRNAEIVKTSGILGNLVGGTAKLSPAVLKTLLAASAVTGVTGGSLAWLANRGMQQDEPKLEAMKNRIDYYNQLTGEIENELAQKRTPATREDVERAVQNVI